MNEIRPSVLPATPTGDARPPASASASASANSRTTRLPRAASADIAERDRAPAARLRLRVLRAGSLRTGQHVARIQVNMVHARCSVVQW